MFAVSSLWIALILVVGAFEGSRAATQMAPRPQPSGLAPAQEAAALAEVGDYEGAWRLYDAALQSAPEDVSLWYALGVALSRLDQREETEVAFRFVVDHGKPDSEEVRLARQWLVAAGVLAPQVAFSAATAAGEAIPGTAAVKGKATWGEPEAGRQPLEVRLVLQGVGGTAEGNRFTKRVPLGQAFRFDRLPAGSYRLVGSAAGHRVWDLTLSVEDGSESSLDLGKDNSGNPSAELYL
jgi:tetratricopeptide (TPR) repeat protein